MTEFDEQLREAALKMLFEGASLMACAIQTLPQSEERDDLFVRQTAIYRQMRECLGEPDDRSFEVLVGGMQKIAVELDGVKDAARELSLKLK